MLDASPQPQATTSGSVLDERLSSPGLLLALLGHLAMRRLRDVHTAHNLTPRQFRLLGLLHDRGTTGQRDLGQMLGTDPSILVTMLNPLEAGELILRQRDHQDRRCHLVTLTPAGEELLLRAAQAQRDAEDELLSGLDSAQREELRLLLVELQNSLGGRGEVACASGGPGGECAFGVEGARG